jgi:hypothetical protein
LHENPQGFVDLFGIVSQAHQEGVDVGVLVLPVLRKGDEAGSEWSQDFVIHFGGLNPSFGGAGGKGLIVDLVEGLFKFVVGRLACPSFGWGIRRCCIINFVGGTRHGGSSLVVGVSCGKMDGKGEEDERGVVKFRCALAKGEGVVATCAAVVLVLRFFWQSDMRIWFSFCRFIWQSDMKMWQSDIIWDISRHH